MVIRWTTSLHLPIISSLPSFPSPSLSATYFLLSLPHCLTPLFLPPSPSFPHLNNIETDVLIEGVEDDLCQTVVVPRTVNQEKVAQETELEREGRREWER